VAAVSPPRVLALAAAILLAGACTSAETEDVDLIPLPAELAVEPGTFELIPQSRIAVSEGAEAVGELLAGVLRPSTGFDLPVVVAEPTPGDLGLVLDPDAGQGSEGYLLDVTDRGATIRAEATAGLFYGCQTLRQLLPPDVESATLASDVAWVLPRVVIADRPRFAWRGTMLDVARHFFSVDEVKRQIELAAFHKLNRFHLHLTDDQGWRIEISSWPLLTEIGGSTQVGGGPGGFFTQQDYSELVAFAEARFVTLIPEIDLPGHVNAALASYAELNEDGQPADLYTGTSVGFSSLWLEGPATLPFVQDVLAEVAELTPGPWIHVGGDEAFETGHEEYAAFMRQVRAIVQGHGKTLVAWEEVGTADLELPWVAQAWVMGDGADLADEAGASIIASRASRAYLDMMYDLNSPIGTIWAGLTDTEEAYGWDPADDFGGADLLGLEAPLWTETVETPADVDFLAWPRLAGHAEIAWSPATGRSWAGYRQRLAWHGRRLDALGVGYYRSPLVDWR
jgi:hexosaminidase